MTIPTKTALGNEELKSRTHRLGQRHRTVLFLVDGRRPLSEVLSLAQQAGAATVHFEELVRLGMVDVPAEPEPPPPVVPEEPPEAVTAIQLDVAEVREVPDVPTLTEVHEMDLREPPAEVRPPEPVAVAAPVVAPEPPAAPLPVLTAEAEPAPAPPPPAPPPPPLPAPAPPVQRAGPREVPVLSEEASVDSLQQVRNLLVDTLRLDAPLFSARMFMRVRNARTTTDLIDLVWEIQDHLARARHAQRELISLQRAREILGLGNTLVADDSTRPPLDE